MMRTGYEVFLIGLLVLVFLSGCRPNDEPGAFDIELSRAELGWLGEQVFRNECAGREACLVHWNQGEAFPSLGIGHFIWYPTGVEGRFVESFPGMIDHLEAGGAELPDWLSGLEPFDAPWPTREAFLAEASDAESKEGARSGIEELREFLASTKDLQADFLARRAITGLGPIIEAAPESERVALFRRVDELIRTPAGLYALIDYVNFKGEGLAESERYKGQGWGLLQVLQEIEDGGGETALTAFREGAARVLSRRAQNADNPIERERWLPGWLNRLGTYREPQ
jgi:hypothetical protein